MKFLRTESYRSGITLSIGFSLLAKLIAFASSLVLAACFGTSSEMDVYLYVFFVAALVTTFISALNSYVIIPESMRLAEQEGEARSREFVNFFLYVYAALGLLVALVFLAGPAAVFTRISRFDPAALSANLPLLYAALPLFPLILLSGYLVDVLSSRKFFTAPMIASMANNAFVLAFVLLLHRRFGVLSAMLGLTAAYAIQLAGLLLLMKGTLKWDFRFPKLRPSRAVLVNVFFSQLGNLATAVSSYVPMFLLSGLDRGTVSAMNYGRQAAEFPNNFITQQFSSVAGIKFNELFAKRRLDEVDRIAVSSMRALFFLLVPVSLFGAFYADEIISMLFRRGAFDQTSVALASGFFRLFALLLPFYASNTVVTRLFLAAQKIKEGFWYQLAMNLVLAAVITVFVGRYGALGYPAGLLVYYVFSLFSAGLLAGRYFPEVRYWTGLGYLLKVTLLDLAVLLPLYLAVPRLGLSPLPRTVLAAAVYFGLLAWLSVRFGVNRDFHEIFNSFRARLSRLSGGGPGAGEQVG